MSNEWPPVPRSRLSLYVLASSDDPSIAWLPFTVWAPGCLHPFYAAGASERNWAVVHAHVPGFALDFRVTLPAVESAEVVTVVEEAVSGIRQGAGGYRVLLDQLHLQMAGQDGGFGSLPDLQKQLFCHWLFVAVVLDVTAVILYRVERGQDNPAVSLVQGRHVVVNRYTLGEAVIAELLHYRVQCLIAHERLLDRFERPHCLRRHLSRIYSSKLVSGKHER